MPNLPHACVIGAGFAGLSAASHLSKKGFRVTLVEKNDQAGGRARRFESEGFTFDMGPSWYWMPDVFDHFFNALDSETQAHYELKRLDPSYRIFFEGSEIMDVPASMDELYALFEQYEKGSSEALKKFLKESEYKYDVGINDLVYKPSRSLLEFANSRVLKGLFRMDLFSSMSSYIRKHFTDSRLIRLLEFPVLFLGATAKKTPALYSLMNYADLCLGTWYPMGGMHKIVEGMVRVAEEKGVELRLDEEVTGFSFKEDGTIGSIRTTKGEIHADVVIGGADYAHVDQQLLPKEKRNYSPEYWDKRKMAPSSLLFYLGVDKPIPGLLHHNLFFDEDFTQHAHEIYDEPQWPEKPLFYASCPSKTDPSVAPEGKENLFLLIPVAPDLEDSDATRAYYYDLVMDRLEARTGMDVRSSVVFKRSYAHREFMEDYHAFKGNAYGLANTLDQTALLKPSLKSKKIKNLYFTGQLTTPGPGVPPSLISGEVVSNEIAKEFNPQ